MTGCQDLAWGLMVWWFVLVMVWVVVCWLRCWRICRGFRQLREGSDDPPPVSMGASAWADATPRPASRLSRTVIIARMRRRRETRCIKPKPLHQTPNGINTACLFKVLPVGKPPIAQRQFCITLQEPCASQSSSRRPPLFTLPPSPSTTHKPGQSPTTMKLLVEEKRLFPAIIRNWEHGRRPS